MSNPARIPLACMAMALGAFFLASHCHAASIADYTGQDLQGKDFKDGALNGAKFENANLSGANLRNATLKGANFRNANLQHVTLAQANMDDADFTGADLSAVDWTDARAWHANLAGTKIDLAGAVVLDLKKLNLDYGVEKILTANRRSDSGALSFHYADLRGCKIAGNADGVDFRGADLRGADFSKALNVDKARLGDAKYDETTRWNIDPAAMHAVLVVAPKPGSGWMMSGSTTAAPPKISHHPLIGNWLILKGEKGATESGSLLLHADCTFDWDYSATGKPIKGIWEEAGDNIVIKQGEKGETWTMKKTGTDEVLLSGDKGTERVGVLDK